MSMFNAIDWTRATQKLVCTKPKKWLHVRPSSSQDTGLSWGPVSDSTCWSGKFNLKDTETLSLCRWSNITILRYFGRQNHCRLDRDRRSKLPSPRYFRQQEASHQYHIGEHFVFTICQLSETEHQVPTPQIDLEPEQLSLITQKNANHVTNSRRLVATTHRESRDADSESFRTGSICWNGGKWTTLHYQ